MNYFSLMDDMEPETFCGGLERGVRKLSDSVSDSVDHAVERVVCGMVNGAGNYVQSIFGGLGDYIDGRNYFDDEI